MENKKSPHGIAGNNKKHDKDTKKYLVNMPKKLGLTSGKKYFFLETEKGYVLHLSGGLYMGMPKIIIENNPNLYTMVEKGQKPWEK